MEAQYIYFAAFQLQGSGLVPELRCPTVWSLNIHDHIILAVQKKIMQTPLTFQDRVNANQFIYMQNKQNINLKVKLRNGCKG